MLKINLRQILQLQAERFSLSGVSMNSCSGKELIDTEDADGAKETLLMDNSSGCGSLSPMLSLRVCNLHRIISESNDVHEKLQTGTAELTPVYQDNSQAHVDRSFYCPEVQ